jgi:hypothetical protein
MTVRRRIFISYRHVEPDQTVARAVGEALDAEHDVFADWKIVAGQRWGDVIDSELHTCDTLIAFTSKESADRDTVLAEVATAHDIRRNGRPAIIPVRLAFDGPLRYPLRAYLDFFQHLSWKNTEDTPKLIGQLKEALEPGAEGSRGRPSITAEQKKRQGLLRQIRLDYVEALLAQSLYSVAPLQLGFLSDSGSVERPINAIVSFPDQPAQALPPGTRITEIFDQSAGAMLLLGDPGTGKTTLLLELARDLLDRADADENQPIPVVANLSSWALPRKLKDWLVQDLNQRNHFRQRRRGSGSPTRRFCRCWTGWTKLLPIAGTPVRTLSMSFAASSGLFRSLYAAPRESIKSSARDCNCAPPLLFSL